MQVLINVCNRFDRNLKENAEVQKIVFRILIKLVHRDELRNFILENGGYSNGFKILQSSYGVANPLGEDLRSIIRDFLIQLVEVKPASLALFFDREAGLTTLRTVLENCIQESVFCANILWTSLLDTSGAILNILKDSTGFRLLGDLLKCENANARVYGGLLLCQVIHSGGLDSDGKYSI